MKMTNIKKYALSLALFFLLGLSGAMVSCGGQGTSEQESEQTEEMEGEGMEEEHMDGEEAGDEHPSGGEHPHDEGDEHPHEEDSTSME